MSKFLEDFKAYIEKKHYHVYSIAEVSADVEEELDIVPGNPCQDSYSVAKAFVVTAIGMLYDRGLLKPEDKALELMGDECPTYSDKRWEKVTVHHLLTHGAGLSGGFLDIDCFDATEWGEDYLAYMLSVPLAYEPGTDRVYSDGAFYFLARIAEHLSGQNLLTFMWKEFLLPAHCREAAWSTCPKGHVIGATGLYTRAIDMARLGWVYQNGGMYEGKRLISEEWIGLVRKAPYEFSTCENGLYGKGGMRGQMLVVDPKAGRAVAWHGFEKVDSGDMMNFVAAYRE